MTKDATDERDEQQRHCDAFGMCIWHGSTEGYCVCRDEPATTSRPAGWPATTSRPAGWPATTSRPAGWPERMEDGSGLLVWDEDARTYRVQVAIRVRV